MSFPCPECGDKTRVHNSHPVQAGVQRGRRCVACAHLFNTLELTVAPRTGGCLAAAASAAEFTRESLHGMLQREEARSATALAGIRAALQVQMDVVREDIAKAKGAMGGH